jgi:hypothetical protein
VEEYIIVREREIGEDYFRLLFSLETLCGSELDVKYDKHSKSGTDGSLLVEIVAWQIRSTTLMSLLVAFSICRDSS